MTTSDKGEGVFEGEGVSGGRGHDDNGKQGWEWRRRATIRGIIGITRKSRGHHLEKSENRGTIWEKVEKVKTGAQSRKKLKTWI